MLANHDGKSANLVSDEELADVEVYVEYELPSKTNGGICAMATTRSSSMTAWARPTPS